jgi:hypothetical protein
MQATDFRSLTDAGSAKAKRFATWSGSAEIQWVCRAKHAMPPIMAWSLRESRTSPA